MSKKKSRKKSKKNKKLTFNQLKEKLENFNTELEVAKKVGFDMIKDKHTDIIDPKEKADRKEKKYKKDYSFNDDY